MEAPDVTIVLPCYNVAEFLEGALSSLLRQTHPSIEVVVVDDASGDPTADIARRVAATDERIRLEPLERNGGVAAARQRAVELARGEFVWFVDADDEWDDRAVELMLAAARSEKADVVIAKAVTVLPDGATKPVGGWSPPGAVSGEVAFRALLRGQVTGHLWNKLFATSNLRAITFTRIQQHSDQAMVAQVLAGAGSVVAIDPVVYRYRLRQGSIIRSGSRRAESLATLADVVRESASTVDPHLTRDPDFRYYEARYLTLSRMKDTVLGDYPDAQRRSMQREIRSLITPAVLAAVARERDLTRLLLLIGAKASIRAYSFIVRRGVV